jgi:hypothetical protein
MSFHGLICRATEETRYTKPQPLGPNALCPKNLVEESSLVQGTLWDDNGITILEARDRGFRCPLSKFLVGVHEEQLFSARDRDPRSTAVTHLAGLSKIDVGKGTHFRGETILALVVNKNDLGVRRRKAADGHDRELCAGRIILYGQDNRYPARFSGGISLPVSD